jgi:hypothetical protein
VETRHTTLWRYSTGAALIARVTKDVHQDGQVTPLSPDLKDLTSLKL